MKQKGSTEELKTKGQGRGEAGEECGAAARFRGLGRPSGFWQEFMGDEELGRLVYQRESESIE